MKISAALIVKNEEENLPRLLKSITDKFDEIVVIDTGSSDNTIEIAKEFGCKVYEKEWEGFADARNFAISKCSGEWIWHFDADFELEEGEFKKFLSFLENNNKLNKVEAITVKVKNIGLDGLVKGISTQSFIHRNDSKIYWSGNIHEKLNCSLSYDLNIYINHYGYQDSTIQYKKARRNLKLIYKDLNLYKSKKDEREVLIKYFYLFQTVNILSNYNRKYTNLIKGYMNEFFNLAEKFSGEDSLHFFIYYSPIYLIDVYKQRGETEVVKRLIKFSEKGKIYYPDFYLVVAEFYLGQEERMKALENYIKFIESVEKSEKKNFVIEGLGVIVDRYLDLEQVLKKILPSLLDETYLNKLLLLWKEEKMRYAGLTLMFYYKRKGAFKDYKKMYKKLYRRYVEDEFVLNTLLRDLVEQEMTEEIEKEVLKLGEQLFDINPNNYLANRVLGMKSLKNEEFFAAYKYLKKAMLIKKDRELLPILMQIANRLQE